MDEIRIQGTQPGTEAQVLGGQVMPPEDVITREQLQEFSRVLHEYKVGKASTERRMIAAEQWWKLHNQPEEEKTETSCTGASAAGARGCTTSS